MTTAPSCASFVLAPRPSDRALVPVLMFMGMVVAIVSSLGAPLIPAIPIDYQVSLGSAQWSLTIALLIGAVTAPIMGRLGDGPHRRVVILCTLTLVLLGSILAALPLGFTPLLIGRGFQGVGLGLMPLAMTVVRDRLPAERAAKAVALLSITASAGVGLGYPLTGLFADLWGFHAPFWFGAIISAVALCLAITVLPSSSHLSRQPIDGIGAGLLSAALILLLLALSQGGSWGWLSLRLIASIVGAILLFAIWAWHELRTTHPLVNLRLMKNRTVLTANVTGVFAGLGMYMMMPLVTRFVQAPAGLGYGFGASILVAGLVLVPFSIGSVSVARALPHITKVIGRYQVLPLGALVLMLSTLFFLFFRTALWQAFVVMGIAGLGVGLIFAAVPGLIVRSVPASETGSALGINQVLRQIGFSIGSALGGTILAQHAEPPTMLPTNSGYAVSAIVGASLCLFTAVISFALPSRTAHNPSAVSPDQERLLTEESVEGGAAGVMLLEEQTPTQISQAPPRQPQSTTAELR